MAGGHTSITGVVELCLLALAALSFHDSGCEAGTSTPPPVAAIAADLSLSFLELAPSEDGTSVGLLLPSDDASWCRLDSLIDGGRSGWVPSSLLPGASVSRDALRAKGSGGGSARGAAQRIRAAAQLRPWIPECVWPGAQLWLVTPPAGGGLVESWPCDEVSTTWIASRSVHQLHLRGRPAPGIGWLVDVEGRLRGVGVRVSLGDSTVWVAYPMDLVLRAITPVERSAPADAGAMLRIAALIAARLIGDEDHLWIPSSLAAVATDLAAPAWWRAAFAGHAGVLLAHRAGGALERGLRELASGGAGAADLQIALAVQALMRNEPDVAEKEILGAFGSQLWEWPARALVAAEWPPEARARLLDRALPESECPAALVGPILVELEAGQRWSTVRRLLGRFERAWDENPDLAVRLAHAMYRMGELDAAEDLASKLIAIASEPASALMIVACCRMEASSAPPEAAARYLEVALRLAPAREDIRIARAEALGRMDRWDEAVRELKSVIGVNPRSRDAWVLLGLAAVRFRVEDRAMEAIKALRSLDPVAADELERAWNER